MMIILLNVYCSMLRETRLRIDNVLISFANSNFIKNRHSLFAASTIKLPHKIRKEAIDHVW